MRRWTRKWTLVAFGFNGVSDTAKLSHKLADEWNSGVDREWFWTRRGAESAARFYSQLLPVGVRPVHVTELEECLNAIAR